MIHLQLDQLDYQILKELKVDARKSASEIARKVGANARTVRNRIDRLVASNAIRLTAVIDPAMFGYIISIDIFLEISPEHEKEIIQHLLSMPEVSYLANGTSTNEISIEARLKTAEQVGDFLRKRLPDIPGVKVKGYTLVPGILRNIDEWMPPADAFGDGFEQ